MRKLETVHGIWNDHINVRSGDKDNKENNETKSSLILDVNDENYRKESEVPKELLTGRAQKKLEKVHGQWEDTNATGISLETIHDEDYDTGEIPQVLDRQRTMRKLETVHGIWAENTEVGSDNKENNETKNSLILDVNDENYRKESE